MVYSAEVEEWHCQANSITWKNFTCSVWYTIHYAGVSCAKKNLSGLNPVFDHYSLYSYSWIGEYLKVNAGYFINKK